MFSSLSLSLSLLCVCVQVADIPTDHPSCSKQHAVLVFREVPVKSDELDIGPPQMAIKYLRFTLPSFSPLKTANTQISLCFLLFLCLCRVGRPYVIDLQSANGTFLNGKKIDASRYYELLPKDMLKVGQSSREYVLLHDELAKSTSQK